MVVELQKKFSSPCEGMVNLSEALVGLTNDIICRAVFGKKFSRDEGVNHFNAMLTEFMLLMGTFDLGDFVTSLAWVTRLNGLDARVKKCFEDFDKFFESVIDERVECGRGGGGDEREDFLDVLLALQKDSSNTGVTLSRDSIKGLILKSGKLSFNRRSLHHLGDVQNPYQHAISIIGRTLSAFDEDNMIPCFGFGDGPTSFAPIIEMATTIVEQSGGQYHVLLIIADGQVTRSVDLEHGHLSPQEQKTVDAIVKASEYPLSIILVGVGDGPWDMMKEFDDNIPARSFDNFQFVNFTEIMAKNVSQSRKETEFALAALMEIPEQYKATQELKLLG
ncbi:E3 ubiquitin-protein ligase RGLG1 [Acorus calamus]|uniref:E3 ubiquitin-protein ligase RGLG1 n=1 Tax=Acorus calamus TaxID=4465 RepID=A0AAV9F0Z6_ACOCL|nr:E3 ubiquitin-protein ligase RGLG1 [Acorus calamus]